MRKCNARNPPIQPPASATWAGDSSYQSARKVAAAGMKNRKESIWENETNAGLRAKKFAEPFLSVRKDERPFPYFATAVKGGRWYYDAARLCKKTGLKLDPKRKIEPFSRYMMRRLGIARLIGICRHLLRK